VKPGMTTFTDALLRIVGGHDAGERMDATLLDE
jgi:hypothetical protein